MIKYRLTSEKTPESFKEYLKRQFVLADLARGLDITGTGFLHFINGKTQRIKKHYLDFLSEKTGLLYAYDEHGVFFYTEDDPANIDRLLEKEAQKKIMEDLDSLPEGPRKEAIKEIMRILPTQSDRVINAFALLLGIKPIDSDSD